MRNAGLAFVCKPVRLTVATTNSAFTRGWSKGHDVTFPIAHHDGNYFVDDATQAALRDQDRIAFAYADNPNGSSGDIAGGLSENRRVLGLRPHPERAVDQGHGGTDGQALFRALIGEVATA